MKMLVAFLAYEWRAQIRSLRFRVLAALYLGLSAVPALLATANARRVPHFVSGSAWGAEVMVYLPLLTFFVALPWAAEAAVRERADDSWAVLSVSPLSSAGYLLRRWIAVVSVLIPLTAVPLGVAMTLALASGAPVSLGHLVWPWLFVVVPVAVSGAALGFGVGTVTGSFLGGLGIASAGGAVLLGLLGQVLFPLRLAVAGPSAWLGIEGLSLQIQRLSLSFQAATSGVESKGWLGSLPILPMATSDAPLDPLVIFRQSLQEGAATLSFSVLLLCTSVVFLRRTAPDVRPLGVRADHPLRTLLLFLHRLRVRYSPDAFLVFRDWVWVAAGLILALGGLTLHLARGHRILELSAQLAAAERQEWPPPTSPGLVPGRWRLQGELRGRALFASLEAEMVQTGDHREARQITWVLDPSLEIIELSSDRPLEGHERRLDRISIVLAEPLLRGEKVLLSLRLEGRPGRLEPPLVGFGRGDLVLRDFWKRQRRAILPRYLRDPGLSLTVPALSPTRIELSAGSLLPVPRYTPFKFTPRERALGGGGLISETVFPPAALEIELRSAQPAILADSCGGIAEAVRGEALRSSCSLSPAHYVVAGGPFRLVQLDSLQGAVLPGHRERAETFLSALEEAQDLLDQIWPGGEALSKSIALEWPADPGHREWTRWQPWFQGKRGESPRVWVDHRLVRVPEGYLLSGKVLRATDLIPPLLASRLDGLSFPQEERLILRNLLLEVTQQLAGRVPRQGAVLGPTPWGQAAFRLRATEAFEHSGYWRQRWPALVTDLRHRAGDEPLRRALFDLIESEPGSASLDLDSLFGRLTGLRLGDFLDQLLRGEALPVLSLSDVTVVRQGAGWLVEGRVVNAADGHAVCPLRVATEGGPVEITLEIGQEAKFEVVTQRSPKAVLLDPDGRCFRYRASLVPRERVDLAAAVGG